jgi:CheY-like chemotaxis protein
MSGPEPIGLLLVEDNPQDLELMLRALAKANLGRELQVARDGAEALDYIFSEGSQADGPRRPMPKLILLDLKLPKVDGFDVLRRVKSDPRTHRVPIVVLTSSNQPSDIAESYRLGVNSYLVKPVNSDGFAAAVRELGGYWMLLNRAAPTDA